MDTPLMSPMHDTSRSSDSSNTATPLEDDSLVGGIASGLRIPDARRDGFFGYPEEKTQLHVCPVNRRRWGMICDI